ncbi:MAG: DUF1292 domain-containing protein [Clostridiales bacterium]|nr:DUF1292 domain-containing protein [Clostridiales bacterium]
MEKGKERNVTQEEKITLVTDTGEKVEFYVLEETRINGTNYLLVTDSEEEEEEGDCYILRDYSDEKEQDAAYEFVEDDEELEYLLRIFTELMSDSDVDLSI